MKFTITGQKLNVTDALRAHVTDKFSRPFRHCAEVHAVKVVLKHSPHASKTERNTVTVTVKAGKKGFSKTATRGDMYIAINTIVDLIDSEIASRKVQKRSVKGLSEMIDKFDKRVASTSKPPSGFDRRRSLQHQMSA